MDDASARDRLRTALWTHRRAGVRRLPASQRSREPSAQEELQETARQIESCTRCALCETRTRTVPGEGSPTPPILFIGEGPGADEDRTGRPFVGRAGKLLDRMIAAIELRREDVFIANVVKCRPPGNRTPQPKEVAACFPYLDRQIELLRPRVICTLGLPATRALFPDVRSISAVRGRSRLLHGTPVVPTFHPAYLLRNPAAKREAWVDLQLTQRLVREAASQGATEERTGAP